MKLPALLAATALLCVSAHAQTPAEPAKPVDPAAAAPVPAATPAPKRSLLKYTAPKGATTGGRIDGDGGSRGPDGKLPVLYVLTPNHLSLTTHEAPTLYWYQEHGSNTRFEFTLTEPKNPKPLLKLATEQSLKSGIHFIALAKQNVVLKPGVTYKWTIAWVPKSDNRSLNLVAGGSIQRVERDAKIATAVEGAPLVDQAGVFAQNGIWYDALESLSNAIEAAPEDKSLRNLRADLLEQAGLKVAASGERK